MAQPGRGVKFGATSRSVATPGYPVESGTRLWLTESALPGKWHIAVIYLFLLGISWTSSTIAPNDVTFATSIPPQPVVDVAVQAGGDQHPGRPADVWFKGTLRATGPT